MCVRVCVLPHLYFIVLEEHVGFEVVDGLVDDVGVTACRKQKHIKKREVTSNQSPGSSRNSNAATSGWGGSVADRKHWLMKIRQLFMAL